MVGLLDVNSAWTKLAPHRPLRQGDAHYAERPKGGGPALAELVRAGWKRIAVVGPNGVGKSTELAAAQQRLYGDRFAFRIGIDLTFDMRKIRAGEVFVHILKQFLATKPNADVQLAIDMAEDLTTGDRRDFRRDLARKVLRGSGSVTLLVDGLEKASDESARAVAEELFSLGDDVEVILVVPPSLAYGPGAAVLGDDVRLASIRPLLVWGEPHESVAYGKSFLREVALRHLEQEPVGTAPEDQELLELIDRASVASGGIPRALLQLLRDAYRHAIVAQRASPTVDDLEQAIRDHSEYLQRMLVSGDVDALRSAEGHDGSEVPLDRKLRFLLQGLLLEYRRGDRVVVHVAPALARALSIKQGLP